jgi:hypothetical protein
MSKNLLGVSRKHLHGRVLYQLVIFAIVSIVMLGIVGVDIMTGQLDPKLGIGGIVLGLIIGFLVGRIFAIKWHQETQKVIINMDRTGFLIIIIYVAFRIFGEQLFGEFLHGAALTAFTFSMLAGIMIGRLISMYRRVMAILREQKILK